ncbi:MAG: hypothetical protein ACLQDV_11750 [Candidatus Binataceae bacterium]
MLGKNRTLAALIACLMLFSPAICRAATITVTSLSDSGALSLREAITNANPGDSIIFSVTGKITLVTTLPIINQPLTIVGPTSSSSGITIDGNNQLQIMVVGFNGTLNLQYLTLAHGSLVGQPGSDAKGGAIFNVGTLSITNCTLSNNQATGGAGAGSNPAGGGIGGAIYNHGPLTTVEIAEIPIPALQNLGNRSPWTRDNRNTAP